MSRAAVFSPCRKYRYSLEIIWDESKPLAAFIGLNPSTADEVSDDPTIRRCIGFAKREGCGGLRMLNLFAYRATDPREMKAAAFPVGGDNDLRKLLDGIAGPIIACWGSHGDYLGRDSGVRLDTPGMLCFGRNGDGSPKHPLYLRGDAPLIVYTEAAHERESSI
jgi:hypothetical protein